MNGKNRGTLKPTGIFRAVEERFSPPEVEICRGTKEECMEIFESRGDRIEQMYHDADPNALTGECWIDKTEEYARE
jgi:hypothetical protein